MLEDFLASKDFADLMRRHVKECLELILSGDEGFEVLANMNLVSFEPPLPEHLELKNEVALFVLSGYTLESAQLTSDSLVFEAGFGDENYATTVSIRLGGILRISMQKAALLVNFSIPSSDAPSQIEKSTNIFKSNPKNKDLFK